MAHHHCQQPIPLQLIWTECGEKERQKPPGRNSGGYGNLIQTKERQAQE